MRNPHRFGPFHEHPRQSLPQPLPPSSLDWTTIASPGAAEMPLGSRKRTPAPTRFPTPADSAGTRLRCGGESAVPAWLPASAVPDSASRLAEDKAGSNTSKVCPSPRLRYFAIPPHNASGSVRTRNDPDQSLPHHQPARPIPTSPPDRSPEPRWCFRGSPRRLSQVGLRHPVQDLIRIRAI